MIKSFFTALIYRPLYNALVALVGVIPSHNMGLAIIILTIVVRILLFPLARNAIKTQMAMKKIAPEIEKVRDRYKDDKQAETRAILDLYKQYHVSPFASIGVILLQIPVLLGLYFVFAKAGFPHVDPSLLYSFVSAPRAIDMHFLGIWNMAQNHSIVLAITAGLTQMIYTRLSMGPRGVKNSVEASLSNDMAQSFDLQARFVLPLFIMFVGYSFVSAAALYYTTSNLSMIVQELLSGRRFTNATDKGIVSA